MGPTNFGLDEESSLKTTFWTPFGRYIYLRLPFGINSAPEEFERVLRAKMDGLPETIVLRNDMLIVGRHKRKQGRIMMTTYLAAFR